MIDVTAALAPERATLLDLLSGLSADAWECATECPAWTVQQLALHILGDDLSLLARQRDATPKQGLILYAESHPGLTFRQLLDGFNEQWVTASTFLSSELLMQLLRLAGAWSDDFYSSVGLDTVSREPVGFFAQTEASPYWQVIAREYAERIVHHSQIRRAIGAPELRGELIGSMALVVVHAVAHWLVDYRAIDGATIGVNFGAAGGWTLSREPDEWSVRDGIDSADALATVAADDVVAFLTRGTPRAEELVTLEGDEQLGNGALALVAPLLSRP